MAITAADINKLKQMTGAGMIDCRNALSKAQGNFEKAIDILAEKEYNISENLSNNIDSEKSVISDKCPYCKNPNTKKSIECEWCGNKII